MTKTIASFCPYQVNLVRTYGAFHIPACKDGTTPVIVMVVDGRDKYDAGDDNQFEHLVPADKVAEDLVHEFTDKGMFVCAGEAPTRAELAAGRAKLEQYYQKQLAEGDALYADPRTRSMINHSHRAAVSFLGERREWVYIQQQKYECPACGGDLRKDPVELATCQHCHAILNAELAEQFGLVEPKEVAVKGRK